ncbi:peroxin-26 [Sarotherodon galilaeus]
MEQFLILALLAVGTHALVPVDETTCDLRTSTCPCSPFLEGTVYIQVMTDASGHEMKCLKVLPKVNITVFNLKKETVTTKDKEFNNRLQFLIKNGTLKITNVRRNDSGQYSVEVFNSIGVQQKNIYFTLDVKDNGKVEGKALWNLEADKFLYLIIACLAILLIAVSCCFVCREMKHRKKPVSRAPETMYFKQEVD